MNQSYSVEEHRLIELCGSGISGWSSPTVMPLPR